MYECKCGNKPEFQELNVMKTYINQENEEESGTDEFFYRADVNCLKCRGTLSDKYIEEIYSEDRSGRK